MSQDRSELLSRFIFWIAWISFILIGASVLGIGGLQQHISQFFAFLPRLFAALFIFFFGLLAASFFSRAALLAAVNADLPSPRLVSFTIRTMIIVFALSMGFEELGLGERTVLVAFTLVFGALMLGLALAFGIGGQSCYRICYSHRWRQDTFMDLIRFAQGRQSSTNAFQSTKFGVSFWNPRVCMLYCFPCF